jgi:hypothetical protein
MPHPSRAAQTPAAPAGRKEISPGLIRAEREEAAQRLPKGERGGVHQRAARPPGVTSNGTAANGAGMRGGDYEASRTLFLRPANETWRSSSIPVQETVIHAIERHSHDSSFLIGRRS